MSKIQPFSWRKNRTPLPGLVQRLALQDEGVNKIIVNGLKDGHITIHMLGDVIELLHEQRMALMKQITKLREDEK